MPRDVMCTIPLFALRRQRKTRDCCPRAVDSRLLFSTICFNMFRQHIFEHGLHLWHKRPRELKCGAISALFLTVSLDVIH